MLLVCYISTYSYTFDLSHYMDRFLKRTLPSQPELPAARQPKSAEQGDVILLKSDTHNTLERFSNFYADGSNIFLRVCNIVVDLRCFVVSTAITIRRSLTPETWIISLSQISLYSIAHCSIDTLVNDVIRPM